MIELSATNSDNFESNSTSETHGVLDLTRHSLEVSLMPPQNISEREIIRDLADNLFSARRWLVEAQSTRELLELRLHERDAEIANLHATITAQNTLIAKCKEMFAAVALVHGLGAKTAPFVKLAGMRIGRGMKATLIEVFNESAPRLFPDFVQPQHDTKD